MNPAFALLGSIKAEAAGSGLYEPGEGELHHTLPVFEFDKLVDIVAWRPAPPMRWSLRTGDGWLLGHDNLERHEGWAEPLPLYASPLDWYQAGCDGIAIVDWRSNRLNELRTLTAIVAANRQLGARLDQALRSTVHLPAILVPQELRHAA